MHARWMSLAWLLAACGQDSEIDCHSSDDEVDRYGEDCELLFSLKPGWPAYSSFHWLPLAAGSTVELGVHGYRNPVAAISDAEEVLSVLDIPEFTDSCPMFDPFSTCDGPSTYRRVLLQAQAEGWARVEVQTDLGETDSIELEVRQAREIAVKVSGEAELHGDLLSVGGEEVWLDVSFLDENGDELIVRDVQLMGDNQQYIIDVVPTWSSHRLEIARFRGPLLVSGGGLYRVFEISGPELRP